MQFGSGIIEATANKILLLDPSFEQRSQPLRGKRLVVKLAEIKRPICVIVSQGGICISNTDEAPDCEIITSIATLREMQDPSQITRLIKQEQLDINGDIHIAQGFSQLIKDTHIDWEEQLSQYVGDALAHKIARMIKHSHTAINNKLADSNQIATEALQDELQVAPHPIEVKQFNDGVTQIRKHTDALAVRLERLHASLNHLLSSSNQH